MVEYMRKGFSKFAFADDSDFMQGLEAVYGFQYFDLGISRRDMQAVRSSFSFLTAQNKSVLDATQNAQTTGIIAAAVAGPLFHVSLVPTLLIADAAAGLAYHATQINSASSSNRNRRDAWNVLDSIENPSSAGLQK